MQFDAGCFVTFPAHSYSCSDGNGYSVTPCTTLQLRHEQNSRCRVLPAIQQQNLLFLLPLQDAAYVKSLELQAARAECSRRLRTSSPGADETSEAEAEP